MLYFSETDWTLPDMASVSVGFDREYDQDDYEQKIAGLARKVEQRNRAENPEETEAWHDALRKLGEGDNYLTVLIRMVRERPAKRPPHDILKLCATAFALVFGLIAFLGLGNWLFGSWFVDWFLDHDHGGLLILLAAALWFFWKSARLSRKG